MRARQKFSTVTLYVPVGIMDVLAAGAERHGQVWHEAYAEDETLVHRACEAETVRVIQEWAATVMDGELVDDTV